jgi:hypothetical protein
MEARVNMTGSCMSRGGGHSPIVSASSIHQSQRGAPDGIHGCCPSAFRIPPPLPSDHRWSQKPALSSASCALSPGRRVYIWGGSSSSLFSVYFGHRGILKGTGRQGELPPMYLYGKVGTVPYRSSVPFPRHLPYRAWQFPRRSGVGVLPPRHPQDAVTHNGDVEVCCHGACWILCCFRVALPRDALFCI